MQRPLRKGRGGEIFFLTALSTATFLQRLVSVEEMRLRNSGGMILVGEYRNAPSET